MSRIDLANPLLFTKQDVVTASRSLGTVFQNTTGKPMFVSISISLLDVTGIASVTALTDQANPPTTGVETIATNIVHTTIQNLVFIVLPGSFYKANVDNAGQTNTLSKWTEWS